MAAINDRSVVSVETSKNLTNRDGSIENMTRFRYDQVARPAGDGITVLATGDELVKDGDREILLMPNGDRLTINKSGLFELKAMGRVEMQSQDGTTSIAFANGDSLLFSDQGVETVSRGNVIVDVLPSTQDVIPRFRKPDSTPEPVLHSGERMSLDWLNPSLLSLAAR